VAANERQQARFGPFTLDLASRELRNGANTVRLQALPFEATTPSLEALKAYSLGVEALSWKGDADALPFLKRTWALNVSSGPPTYEMICSDSICESPRN
jgi:hypothetical protein